MRHEVTAAHTRSLFCSLQLFFLPLRPDGCHSHSSQELLMRSRQQESHALFPSPLLPEFLHPNARPAGVETRSARTAAASKPQLLTRALRTSLFGDTHCWAAAARKVESRSLSPPPTPSFPLVRTAHFACRVRKLIRCPTPRLAGVSPTLGKLGRSAGAVLGAAGRNFSRLFHSEHQPWAGQPCSFQDLVVALGFC